MLVDRTQWAVERGIEALGQRHGLLADNIANVETPGFKRRDVSFRPLLAEYLGRQRHRVQVETTRLGHINGSGAAGGYQIKTWQDSGTTMRADGNSVDIDREMAALARNGLEYQTLVTQASRRLAMLRTVITEGRR
ncbi:MAG: flagellar basal body rod protein FlgB [Thermaerobacterales bacterium]